MIGRTIQQYQIQEQIGAGGMAVVYRARDSILNRPVAVKAIRDDWLRETSAVQRFRREALAAASIDHPFICSIFELLEENGHYFMVMEFVDGQALSDVLDQGKLALSQTLRYGKELSEALNYAHAKGLIHRDIKPSNIMITASGHVKLMDFGIATAVQEEELQGEATRLTSEGSFVGTPKYMSPEQATGDRVDARSDIFSLGVVLYQCLTGQFPFQGSSPPAYLRNMLSSPPRPPSELNPVVPLEVEQIVLRCLALDPSRRYQSARELEVDLVQASDPSQENTIKGLTLSAPRRTPWLAGIVLVLLFVLAGILWMAGIFSEPVWTLSTDFETPLVTSPADETGSRISPDKRWTSFISHREGTNSVWIQRLPQAAADVREPQQIFSVPGNVISQVWSPDGSEIACLVRKPDEQTFLQIISVPPARQKIRLEVVVREPFNTLLLTRWLGSHIYAEMDDRLWRFHQDSGELEPLLREDMPFQRIQEFDVRKDEGRIAFIGLSEGRQDLWISDLDGNSLEQVTNDSYLESRPFWLDERGDYIVYSSNRNNRIDLWIYSIEHQNHSSLAPTSVSRLVEDMARDGTFLIYNLARQEANLWELDPGEGAQRQLTANSLNDFLPSVADETLAFQRNKAGTGELGVENLLVDAQIFHGSISDLLSGAEQRVAGDGFQPRLSGDGRWLAFLQTSREELYISSVYIKDLASGRSWEVDSSIDFPGFSQFPLDVLGVNLLWSHDSQSLYYVRRAEGQATEIRRYDPTRGAENAEVVVKLRSGQGVQGLHMSGDGAYLAFVVTAENGRRSDLQLLRLEDQTLSTLTSYSHGPGGRGGNILTAGWTADSQGLVILRALVNPDYSQNVEVNRVDLSGNLEILGKIERAFAVSARLDTQREMLYLTRAEGDIHNIFSFSLNRQRIQKITENQLPRVTFSGLDLFPNGKMVCSRQRTHGDLWLLKFSSTGEQNN